jgi:hypothetical protein
MDGIPGPPFFPIAGTAEPLVGAFEEAAFRAGV